MSKNIIETSWGQSCNGLLSNQFSYTPITSFDLGLSYKFYFLSKLPKLIYSIKDIPGEINTYLNITHDLIAKQEELINLADRLKVEEEVPPNAFNVTIDYDTKTLFSFGTTSKQYLGKSWQEYRTPLSLENCNNNKIPGDTNLLFMVNGNLLLLNNKKYARDFIFLLILETLDVICDGFYELRAYGEFHDYTRPNDYLLYFTSVFVKEVLKKQNTQIDCYLDSTAISVLSSLYSKVVPLYPANCLSLSVDKIKSDFHVPEFIAREIISSKENTRELSSKGRSLLEKLKQGKAIC